MLTMDSSCVEILTTSKAAQYYLRLKRDFRKCICTPCTLIYVKSHTRTLFYYRMTRLIKFAPKENFFNASIHRAQLRRNFNLM